MKMDHTQQEQRSKSDYVHMQRRYYDERARTLEDARELVHLDFGLAHTQALHTQVHALLDFVQRTHSPNTHTSCLREASRSATGVPVSLRALDFGCGVGRLMEPLAGAGLRVDGVDISSRMLHFARQNPQLKDSSFFLSNGNDCGDAPKQAYDLVYSHLCFQHICSRTIRNELLSGFRDVLRPGGVVFIQMHYYPDQRASTVPSPHVPWSADNFGAQGTNSDADVWPTPDELHLIYDDFSRYFEDLRFQFVDFPREIKLFTDAYNAWFAHLIVSGSVGRNLASRLYAS